MEVSDECKAIEVVKALSDDYSRKIILSIVSNCLPIEEISREQNIPISTCYRRVHEMLRFGVIRPAQTIIREDGKKFVCYKSAIKNATIQLDSGELKVDVVLNRDPAEKPLASEIPMKVEATDSHVTQKILPTLFKT